MDQQRFARIRSAFQKNGGIIDTSEAAQNYLRLRGADGLTFDSKTILLPEQPTTSAVFEEFIHTAQYRTGRFSRAIDRYGNRKAEALMELEAAEKLIRNQAKWGIPEAETLLTKERLNRLKQGMKR